MAGSGMALLFCPYIGRGDGIWRETCAISNIFALWKALKKL